LTARGGSASLPRRKKVESSEESRRSVALTRRQREILDFIRGFIAERGYSPSLEEIGAHFGLSSVATVHKHVQRLVEKRMLKKAANRSRSVEPSRPEEAALVTLPLLGSVAAGLPIEAVRENETIAVPAEMVPRGARCFVLRVRGSSMIEEQICDGDLVIVESRQTAADGETVVALVRRSEVTLKKLRRRGSSIALVPANSALRPLVLPARDVEIQGVVRGLVRRYTTSG
jgi:repressor LexA